MLKLIHEGNYRHSYLKVLEMQLIFDFLCSFRRTKKATGLL
jgi:hypothetical protein